MRRPLIALLVLISFVMLSLGNAVAATDSKEAADMGEKLAENITWLGHDTFRIKGALLSLYTDPFQIKGGIGGEQAGIVLITHEHRDHCSAEDVLKIQGPDTVIIAPPDCAPKLKGDVRWIKPGDRITVKGIVIEAVPAYNTNKKFHPRANNWVGYVFTLDGVRYYLAGDTDYIPEMKGIECDVALLPVSGTYVMTADEAVNAALDIKPKLAIPMHYGAVAGTEADAKAFAEALEGKVAVKIFTKTE